MGIRLFTPEERPLAQSLARLVWMNPFEDARKELEREILEAHGSRRTEKSDLSAILALLERTIESGRMHWEMDKAPNDRDAYLYQELVFFHVFHQFRRDFDKVIEAAHARGSAAQRIPFYDRFCQEVRHWLPQGFVGDYAVIDETRLFGVFFQVRRAFQHIFQYIVGTSPAATKLRARIWQSIFTHDMDRYQRVLADRMGDIITLITGPSGTGKELVARAIGLSRFIPFNPNTREFDEDFIRAFYPINLSALSSNLIESELFGHRKGAFTGALHDRKGYLSVCGQHGTVFLDEIGETEPSIQVKLLRLLQTRSFSPIGDTEPRNFQGKIMAATNRDLLAEIEAGRFREDFYFRLNADHVRTPSLREILRESPGELENLVSHIARKLVGPDESAALTDEAMVVVARDLSDDYPWPGNFRELEQCVRNILVHGEYMPQPLGRPDAQSPASELALEIQLGRLTANELMSRYVSLLYEKTPNYEELGRRLELDRRTVKKYVNGA
ncbi:sigma-54 factor interaction domain-containing protein [Cerasicoccus maritimus]|uniref:sigma-54 factor interaction domain-containing protein n=1 Tax=Cerasicoccus maritimus TaxID=490089 RepID=UPI002852627D|nr:sigma-54 factor interaction domain-containing protein [Cerasicoccus maritimus]